MLPFIILPLLLLYWRSSNNVATILVVAQQEENSPTIRLSVPTPPPAPTQDDTPPVLVSSPNNDSITTTPTQPSSSSSDNCYSNLTDIAELSRNKNIFILEIYVLCPNTTYYITKFEDLNTTNHGTGYRTIYPRSNSIYKCGSDGKSNNNCIITGGDVHLQLDLASNYYYENKVNIIIQGITFDNAYTGAIWLAAPGDITFYDCIFRNHQNFGVMPISFSYENTRNLLQDDSIIDHHHHHDSRRRHLQGGDLLEVQKVTIDGCIFENNMHGPESPVTIDGIISIEASSNELVILNSIFRNNTYTQPYKRTSGYAIFSVEGIKINITNVCFIDNQFTGDGVVTIPDHSIDDNLFVYTNVSGTIDPTLRCPFAHTNNDTCIDYDSDICYNVEQEKSGPIIPIAPSPTTLPTTGNTIIETTTTTTTTTSNGVLIRKRIRGLSFLIVVWTTSILAQL